MKIAIFTDYYLPHIGGTETSIYHQRRALEANGHKVYVITTKMVDAYKERDDEEYIVRIPSQPLKFRFEGMQVYLYNKNAYKILDKLNIDIVHVQTEFGIGMLGVRYSQMRKLKLIYTAHTALSAQIELMYKFPIMMALLALISQKLFLHPKRKIDHVPPKDMCHGIATKTLAQKLILKVWVTFASQADVIIAPSLRQKQFLSEQSHITNIVAFPNPYPFDVTKLPLNLHKPLKFVSVGRISGDKRPNITVDAFLQLNPKIQPKVRLDIYGGGPLLDSLKQKSINAKNIKFHGFIEPVNVQKVLRESDVFILASKGFDTQPMVILEALNAGLAIIYCDENLKAGLSTENSILFSGDSKDLSDKVNKLVTGNANLVKMKEASRRLANNFSYDSFAESYNKVIKQLK